MQQQLREKRNNAIFIPIKRKDSDLEVYLQKRALDAPRLPGRFGFWGGGIEEGESPEQGLVREVQEELGIQLDLEAVQFVTSYEFLNNKFYTFVQFVTDEWEHHIIIGEGDYGQWFTLEAVLNHPDIILENKVILHDLERVFLNKPIK